ncbi:MAG TPA: nucleoside-diphosphate kinase [Candidatus Dormibacteraeota bacterium]|jgi:nucleoside-diphosphate kinase|nr:nucleoside-diphosphate kinase [Candidatus Dormibacteraeota bacterium]
MATERTLVLVKPDGVQRGLVGEVICRLERRGLQLNGMKLMRISEELAGRHYAEHRDKPFFAGLVSFITSAPVVAMVWQGPGAVAMVRAMMGATNPANAAPGTIRGDLAVSFGMNVIHGSDSAESAQREVDLFFAADEVLQWERTIDPWVIEE